MDDAELARRREAWQGAPDKGFGGYLARYASMVTSAAQGAVFKKPEK